MKDTGPGSRSARWSDSQLSRKWFRVGDTYGVDIAAGQDDVLILAVTVIIDLMAH